ncbi:MAG: glycosyltransferase family 2 protein [Halobacteriota archaeon]
MDRVAFLIPTLNEAPSIGLVIESIPVAELADNGYETAVYVVDGRSADQTREIAVQKGAQVITEERSGKGAAIQTAFLAVDADYVIIADGDNTYPVSVATEMLRLLQTNDVVIGSRLKGSIEPGAMTRLNVVGNILLTSLARLLFHAKISDVCTGLWGYRRDALRRLELAADGFEIEAEMFAECVSKGLRIVEIPITYRAREDQPKLSSLRDGVKIGLFLCKRRVRLAQLNRGLSESEKTERSERVKLMGEETDAGH